MDCQICGIKENDDLFLYVNGGRACSICTIKFVGGLPATEERVQYQKQLKDFVGKL